MDPVRALLIIVLVLTTLFLAVVGVQLILTLVEFRKTLKKMNRVIDGFESAGINLGTSISEMGGFVSGFKSIVRLFELVDAKKYESKTRR